MDLTGVSWRKASYSGNNGGDCVEVGVWRKASFSGSNGGGCVEIGARREAGAEPLYLVRDSKNPDGPKLAFSTAGWEAFVAGVKDGEFDLAG